MYSYIEGYKILNKLRLSGVVSKRVFQRIRMLLGGSEVVQRGRMVLLYIKGRKISYLAATK